MGKRRTVGRVSTGQFARSLQGARVLTGAHAAPRRPPSRLGPAGSWCAEEGGEVDDPLQPLAPLLARDPSQQPRRAHLARVRARARARAAALAPAPAARVVRLQCEGCSVPMWSLFAFLFRSSSSKTCRERLSRAPRQPA